MGSRRSHYELAFEAYLRERRVAFVSVEDAKRAIPGRTGVKMFDYLIYPGGGVNYLLEVKGRRMEGRQGARARRWECWVTQADVEGLTQWEAVFGEGFAAAFVFAYWVPAAAGRRDEGDGVRLAGRAYTFQVVSVADYRARQRVRSPRWKTVTLSREDFLSVARSAGSLWGGAASLYGQAGDPIIGGEGARRRAAERSR